MGVVSVMIQYVFHCVTQCVWHVLAGGISPSQALGSGGPIDNPAPQSPLGSSNGVDLLLAYAKYGALIACGVSAVVSGGLMAFGSLSQRPDHVDRGKRALLWSMAGVAVAAIGIPVANTVFSAVH
jgi:hypothetical protein